MRSYVAVTAELEFEGLAVLTALFPAPVGRATQSGTSYLNSADIITQPFSLISDLRPANKSRHLPVQFVSCNCYCCTMSTSSNPLAGYSWWRRATLSCTPEELSNIITAPRNMYETPSDPYNEVYPGILLGNGPTAIDVFKLKHLGVTHVLNTACGKEVEYGMVNTSQKYYERAGIKFMGVGAYDMSSFNMAPFFNDVADFIDSCLRSGGRVYVHCKMGISRSATCVLAYLMIKRAMTAQDAVRLVRSRRQIIPNDGFLKQLCQLNDQLAVKRDVERNRERLMRGYGTRNVYVS